jgi:hypothetical protein
LNHAIHLDLGLLPFLHELLELGVNNVLPPQEGIDEVFFDRKAGFDGFFSSPIFAVSFALDENLV